MASESKEVMLDEMELPPPQMEVQPAGAPPASVLPAGPRAAGPPRFAAPKGVKISRGPMPASVEERLESLATLSEQQDKERIGDGVDLLTPAGPRPGVPRPAQPTGPRPARRPGAGPNDMYEMKESEEAPKEPEVVVDRALPEALQGLAQRVYEAEARDKTEVRPQDAIYKLPTRRHFKPFIIQTFIKYRLPLPNPIPDPDACKLAASASKKEVKTFAYQSFVRDYMQKSSPYRGVLVYHGLGSGKTCTSIAALESLFANNQRPVYILTPASLQPNYIDEITKCGPYIFRTDNHWVWISVPNPSVKTPERTLLVNVGIPVPFIKANRGAWLPDPGKKANFDSLTGEQKRQIKDQIAAHIKSRFIFINYNGLNQATVRNWACELDGTKRKFDGATIIIDEVHNMVRSINNSNLEYFYKNENYKESREMATYKPKNCGQGARQYRIGYLLYRLLCNAVGAKIVALSATPIINFPQEIAILANILGGDCRMAEIPSAGLENKDKIINMLKRHPEVDFMEVIPRTDTGSKLIRVTPVPSGFRKVIDPANGSLRGFVRDDTLMTSAGEIDRELNVESWAQRITASIRALGVPAVDKDVRVRCTTRLPDLEKQFVETFIDTDNLVIKESAKYAMMARLSGLISYYKGGKREFMAEEHNHLVVLDMSSEQLTRYSVERIKEINREKQSAAPQKQGAFDLINKKINSTFKIFSRASCNFAFPEDIERPIPGDEETWGALLMGEKKTKASEEGEDDAQIYSDAVAQDENPVEEIPQTPAIVSYQTALQDVVTRLRAEAGKYFVAGQLDKYSPKFQAILDRLAESKGPALVYSNFKTLEGVGLFSVALEAQQGYKKFDIVKSGSKWVLSPETLASGPDTPRYISYTGDEEREKRNILLAIYNAKWERVPAELADAVKGLCGVEKNITGKIARVIMITQSGAEGISLANVRQVHIMEPYWNYVRLEQVKGRAVRICSHADLPPEERSVDIFTYIVKFSDEQLAGISAEGKTVVNETIKNSDKGFTTDQSIYELMQAKKKLADSIVDVMQKSAVDCDLNKNENGVVGCYTFAGAATDAYMFHPILEEHMKVAAAEVQGTA
jgi:hypothetical protein